ncbi:D-psicose/D-tagatose/L-ribulose 3-epimerase [Roseimicrobium gellanilyticum]|uniref:D-psicose/D-tagatose/L-ribulose 3-epimerase n=1 Tax=Roseimicrobium gellanilyticum TaxID=748857 RepID=A0A366H7V7_9BACT|nr:sugar phosphate isomerase/epimerase family protein [Roseimicrobium gellanilyticum]RBP37646.1 D-psicose/D-tagatose/L-ribulose 3-epimerase [Roseimicrobium gellanilyticum]
MKIGFNLLLWTGHVTEELFPLLAKLKAVGYDGVEIPIFDSSDPSHFKKIGQALKDNGLECTAVTVLPDEAHNAISPDAKNRQGAIDHLKSVLECAHQAGVQTLCGPYYQVLGQFTGRFPTETELDHAAEVHRAIAPIAQSAGVKCAIEALNRFESHLLNTMEQAASYVRRVDHPNFGTMYDTFHANIEEKKPIDCIETVYSTGKLNHIHISENDRGTPGRGHAPCREAIRKAKSLGYDGWLTIEAFGGALPDLAAATRVWRDFFSSPEEVYTEGYALIKSTLAE